MECYRVETIAADATTKMLQGLSMVPSLDIWRATFVRATEHSDDDVDTIMDDRKTTDDENHRP
jgi:hypothetical protein